VTYLKNCRKQQLLTDLQHDVKNIFCLKHKYLHLLIHYLSGYFRRGVNCEIDRNYLILTINKRLFTMKVENHETTKLGNQHKNLLKGKYKECEQISNFV
jgi:hypothetical protein